MSSFRHRKFCRWLIRKMNADSSLAWSNTVVLTKSGVGSCSVPMRWDTTTIWSPEKIWTADIPSGREWQMRQLSISSSSLFSNLQADIYHEIIMGTELVTDWQAYKLCMAFPKVNLKHSFQRTENVIVPLNSLILLSCLSVPVVLFRLVSVYFCLPVSVCSCLSV